MNRTRTLSLSVLMLAAAQLHAQESASVAVDGPQIRLAGTDAISKDALFGTSPTPEPTSKDGLFGATAEAGDKTGVKFSGSFEGLGAYTYADPTHWSRGVGRLTLAAQGAFSESVKWKVGGRVDGDIVYATSNFYLSPVKRNQQASAFWGENYIDVSAGSWDFRIGAQQIIWGEVIGLSSPMSYQRATSVSFYCRASTLSGFRNGRRGREYFAGDTHVEFIWIPVPHMIGSASQAATSIPRRCHRRRRPASPRSFSTRIIRIAISVTRTTACAQTRLCPAGILPPSIIGGMSSQPTFYRLPASPGQPFAFQPRFDRIWQVGGTMSKDLGRQSCAPKLCTRTARVTASPA
jgi:hypothetical protein